MWCGVVWCAEGAVTKGNGQDALAHGKMQAGRAVCLSARCVWCIVQGRYLLWCRAATVPGCPGDALPLCLMVLLKFSLGPTLCASGPGGALMRLALGQLRSFSPLPHCLGPMGSGDPSGQRGSYSIPPHCSGQWTTGILLSKATL